MVNKYKWDGPHEWLDDVSREWDSARLRAELMALAVRLDADELQDEFQTEMDADGYFEPIPEETP